MCNWSCVSLVGRGPSGAEPASQTEMACGLSEVIYNCPASGLLLETAEYYFFFQMTSIILVCVLGTRAFLNGC